MDKSISRNDTYLKGMNSAMQSTASKEIAKRIASVKKQIASIRKKKFFSPHEQARIDSDLAWISGALDFQRTINNTSGGRHAVISIVNPITAIKILPQEKCVYGRESKALSVTAAPGQYEPASFVVRPLEDLNGLVVNATNLMCGSRSIGKNNIDIRTVKCWYQNAGAGETLSLAGLKPDKVLVPELLLHDDSLVKVDHDNKENYLRLGSPGTGKYVWISNPNERAVRAVPDNVSDAYIKLTSDDFPVSDSLTLQPVDIPKNTNKQFWITISVPEGTAPGSYKGDIYLSSQGKAIDKLSLRVQVLPFKLDKPYYTSSIYYMGSIQRDGKGYIHSYFKSEGQMREDLEDMFRHGVTNPQVSQDPDDKLFAEVLRMRQEIGMGKQPIYWCPQVPTSMDDRKMVQRLAKEYGISDVYIYGVDEGVGEQLRQQRDEWNAIHSIGCKVFVAGAAGVNFPYMGDIQDLLVQQGTPSMVEAEKWHSRGHKIWNYGNPQGGVEDPDIYRRTYGLLLWENGYDGACTFAYQGVYTYAWNDFDNKEYRDHMFTYPTINGPIGTVEWEGYKEAVDDVRYVTTLQRFIKNVKSSGNMQKREIARRAEKYLKTIHPLTSNLDEVRTRMTNYILQLSGG